MDEDSYQIPDCFAYSLWSQYALTAASCFMDMKTISQMLENKASEKKIKERILSGRDLKPDIGNFLVIKSTDLATTRSRNTNFEIGQKKLGIWIG